MSLEQLILVEAEKEYTRERRRNTEERTYQVCNYFLATLLALHFTPVSGWVGRSVVVSNYRSFEACELVSSERSSKIIFFVSELMEGFEIRYFYIIGLTQAGLDTSWLAHSTRRQARRYPIKQNCEFFGCQ